jgi:uncharacterized protein (UPF0264 family)
MQHEGRRAGFLASVTSEHEALTCVALGADIIDAKDPRAGALGALPVDLVAAIRDSVPARTPLSATIGDPTADTAELVRRAKRMAATGVDVVKVGIDGSLPDAAALDALGRADIGAARLVAVLIADGGVNLDSVARAGEAGFVGVMLDTADKKRGSLLDIVAPGVLADFVAAAHAAGLFAGLAGSLRVHHIPQLLGFAPDLMGFRGGLCRNGERADAIDAGAVRAVRRAIGAGAGVACPTPLMDVMARRQPEGAA